MRGAKAKALRRMAKASGLPARAYGVKQNEVKAVDPRTGQPILHPETGKQLTYEEPQLVLVRSQRGLVQRSKARTRDLPIVAIDRAARRAKQEALKNMTIEIVDPPTQGEQQ